VAVGEPVLELHVDDRERLPAALAALAGAVEVSPEPPEPRPLIVERIA
jgi:thymidine phosphorylase